jgi:RNA polymerase sigma-70 factor, ECF subfamily
MNSDEEKIILKELSNGDAKSLKILFDTFYPSLCNYAFQFLNDYDMAEEVVQNLFVKIWEKRSTLDIETSVKNYLFRSVRNQCINLIQHEKVKQLHAQKIKEALFTEEASESYYMEAEMAARIESAIETLPEKRREIFRLSREEGLKYREIAEKLEISVKTVETQMGLALKTLRDKFRNSLLLFIFFRKISKTI